ncbi:hypothetical protein [Halococcus hamelinensis]|uniref:DUF8056 domain-containing protein n=1 Tax=Halococcus hamelinensis 100A6 TaxID=1132509 RepID=M0M4E8_9EURY|nr:hypothetical protein [Halococcus hamelinensis]EMA40687.1 hypothetical protein C447_04176 [Halococcus hamelinensis 100A6]
MVEASAGDDADAADGGTTDGSPRADASERTYDGLLGAIPYAFRSSRSRVFRSYAVLGVVAAVLVAVFMTLALVTLFGATAGARGGSLTLSRAFYVVVALFLVGPLLAPVLLVARRHRRVGDRKRYDAWLGFAGFGFLASLYVGLVIAVPVANQEAVTGVLAPLVEALYALPSLAGLVPPILAAVLIWLVHRLAR